MDYQPARESIVELHDFWDSLAQLNDGDEMIAWHCGWTLQVLDEPDRLEADSVDDKKSDEQAPPAEQVVEAEPPPASTTEPQNLPGFNLIPKAWNASQIIVVEPHGRNVTVLETWKGDLAKGTVIQGLDLRSLAGEDLVPACGRDEGELAAKHRRTSGSCCF